MSKNSTTQIKQSEIDFLSDFVKVSAFYVEDLEEYIDEEMLDFWKSRERALQILTELQIEISKETTA